MVRRTKWGVYQTKVRELISGELWLNVTLPGISTQPSERIKNEGLDRAVTRRATRDIRHFSRYQR